MLTITRGWSLKVKPLDDEGAIVVSVSVSLDSSLVSFDEIIIGFRPGLNSDPRSGSGDIEPAKEMVIGFTVRAELTHVVEVNRSLYFP